MSALLQRQSMIALIVTALLAAANVPAYAEESHTFDIQSANPARAIQDFGTQSGIQILASADQLRATKLHEVTGYHTTDAALKILLADTGLTHKYVGDRTVALVQADQRSGNKPEEAATQIQHAAPTNESASSRSGDQQPGADELAGTPRPIAIPEIMVVGTRTINADIERTEDDVQPYVVLDAEEIQRSQATTLEDFLRTRLPMNALQTSFSQLGENAAGTSQINLRGLGTNQTLILVDGRRMASQNFGGAYRQPDINAIPPSMIERIEVLPSTASGIYGGGATGGVINIVTRKDYTGADVSAAYGDTFDGGAMNYRVDASLGIPLEGGRTHIVLAGSYAESDPLFLSDRDFVERSRALQSSNNPSAFYTTTTPPVGYTSNIRSQNGSNLVLDGGTPLSSPLTFVPIGYAGPGSDNGAALVANAGSYNLDLPQTSLTGRSTLLSAPKTRSLSLNVRREFGDRVEAFVDLSWMDDQTVSYGATVPSTVTLGPNVPNNPFTTAINVSFPATDLSAPLTASNESLRGSTGIIVRLPKNWTAALDYTWSRARYSYDRTSPIVGDPDGTGPGVPVTAALSSGTLDVLRDLNAFPLNWSPYLLSSPNDRLGPADNRLSDVALRVSGPLVDLPGGSLTLSGSAGYRKESADDVFQETVNASAVSSTTFRPSRSQAVRSLYLETHAPFVSSANGRALLRGLELQASVRRDDYETESPATPFVTLASREAQRPQFAYLANDVQATEYTAGLRYVPVRGLALRASRGTGFLPPSIDQLAPFTPTTAAPSASDPKRGGVLATVGPFSQTQGGNSNLEEEESESWSAGAVLTPSFLRGLRISVDFTRIEKTNEIITPSVQQLLDLEDILPGRVTRAPLTQQDLALGYTGGMVTAMDRTFINVQGTDVDAYDVQADYLLDTQAFGSFHFAAVSTYQPKFERKVTPTSSAVDSAGFDGGALEWRGNVGITWDKGPWSIGWSTQYYDSYFAYTATSSAASVSATVLNQGSRRIPSQTYHDLFAKFRFGDSAVFANGFLDGTELTLGLQNVLDETPPERASTSASITSYSTYGDPRLQRFTLTLRKSFSSR